MGNTSKPKGSTNKFRFGIYRGATNKTPKDSTHIVYYDEIHYAKKSCDKSTSGTSLNIFLINTSDIISYPLTTETVKELGR